MNTPDPSISPDLLDELISADLDGALDRAASELGFTPEAAHAALATGEASLRRAALAHARERLGAIPVLDPADERHLVVTALGGTGDDLERARAQRAARRRFERSRRVLVAVGAAAAAVAVVIALASTTKSSSSSKSSAASAPITLGHPRLPAPKSAAPVTFGDVSQPGALRARAHTALRLAPPEVDTANGDSTVSSTPVPEAGGPTTTVAASTKGAGDAEGLASDAGLLAMAAPRGLVGDDGVVVNSPNSAIARGLAGAAVGVPAARTIQQTCVAAAARAAGLAPTPAVTGTGTYAGRPAEIVVLHTSTAYVAYVLSVPGCAVITHVSVP